MEKFMTLKNEVCIYGHKEIPEKLVAIVNEILKDDETKKNYNVASLVFRTDGVPTGYTGRSGLDSKCISINMLEIWKNMAKVLKNTDKKLNAYAMIWHELLMTFLHEIHHMGLFEPELQEFYFKEKNRKEIEKDAEEWAEKKLVEYAKTMDIEPPALKDFPFFAARFMELFAGEEKDKEWVLRERARMENGITYEDKERKTELYKYSEYIRKSMAVELDPKWANEPDVLHMTSTRTGEILNQDKRIPKMELYEEQNKEKGETKTLTTALFPEENKVPWTMDIIQPNIEDKTKTEVLFEHNPGVQTSLIKNPQIDTWKPKDQVVLPLHILEEIKNKQAAINPTAANFPTVNLQPHEIFNFMRDVYMRLYTHMFMKCGMQLANDQGFTALQNIYEPVNLADLIVLHKAKGLILGFRTTDVNGQYLDKIFEGYIQGLAFRKSNPHGLPAYRLLINAGPGKTIIRSLIAQNPAKINIKTNMLSTSAVAAREGHAIAWVVGEGTNAFIAEIKDNNYRPI